MLLYGDTPPADEPTLELLRSPLPLDGPRADACREILGKALHRWGWDDSMDAVDGCLSAVLNAMAEETLDGVEVFAFRRAHQLTVELHFIGGDSPVHQLLTRQSRLGVVDALAPLWGVRPLGDGEAVWFEFRSS